VSAAVETVGWRVERSELGVRFSGRLLIHDAKQILAEVREAARDADAKSAGAVELELGDVDEIDSGIAALIGAELNERGLRPHFRHGDQFRGLFVPCVEGAPPPRPPHTAERIAAHVGRVTLEGVDGVERVLGFAGELAMSARQVVRRPRGGHWKDLPLLVERSGFDAIPIVLVIQVLVGFVMAYMAARSLQVFGANLYVADIVGIGVTRQLGPLMTAIIVCGRSGAAFATELGSMKVSEETDALRTLGLDPFGWLVVPRLVALVLVVPVLTLLSNIVGIAGGLVVAVTSLGLTTQAYLTETRRIVGARDVLSGLAMSVAFAIAIGLIACQQGFAASGGPLGVGRRTTSTVVISLFAIVAIDAALTIAFRVLGVL
jgi:phospholipid/cholesterol/gamma-HCH transport system permease protein